MGITEAVSAVEYLLLMLRLTCWDIRPIESLKEFTDILESEDCQEDSRVMGVALVSNCC